MSDWPLITGGLFVSLLIIPLSLYVRLVMDPPILSGIPFRLVGILALAPGFLMGGIGLWMAARG